MVERFLLDWIDAIPAGPSVGRQDNPVIGARPHEAQASLTFMQPAETRAEIALNSSVTEHMPIAPFDARRCVAFYPGHSPTL